MKLKYHGVVISNVGRRWRRWWRRQRMAAAAEAEAEAAVLAEFEAAFEAAVPEDRLCRCGHLCAAVHKFCTMCGTHRDWSPVETRVEDEDLDAAESEEAEVEDEVEAEVYESQLAGLESDRLRREEIMATCRTEMDRARNYNYQPASRAVVNYRSAAAVVRNPKLENWDQSPYHYNETGSQNKPLLCVAGGKVPVVEGNSDVKTRWTANLTTFSDSERFVEGKLPYCELMFKAELAEPAVAEPEVADPDVAAPAVAEPAVAEPAVAEPAVA